MKNDPYDSLTATGRSSIVDHPSWMQYEPADLGQEIARTVEQMVSERDRQIDQVTRLADDANEEIALQDVRIAKLRKALERIIDTPQWSRSIAERALEGDKNG